jgi:predicted ribosomally synthesized peptide with nif11-like leader
MSEEQLSAFLAAVTEDAELQEKLKGAADLDAAVAISKEAGFDVSKSDWLKLHGRTIDLTDEELEGVAGGGLMSGATGGCCSSDCQQPPGTQQDCNPWIGG